MASRKDQKAELRAEREAREREAAASEKRRRMIGYAVGGALAAAALVAIIVVLLAGGDDGGGDGGPTRGDWPEGSVPKQQETDLRAAVEAAQCETKSLPQEGNKHVQGEVRYRSNPPITGDHNEVPAEDGASLEPPPDEQYVHALEHGRIVVQFKPTASDQVKGSLKALFDEDPYHLLLFPNDTQMEPEVAAMAWASAAGGNGFKGELLTCAKYNDKVADAIRAFKTQYRDRGPEAVP